MIGRLQRYALDYVYSYKMWVGYFFLTAKDQRQEHCCGLGGAPGRAFLARGWGNTSQEGAHGCERC